MWSCRLNKIKSGNMKKSIANSETVAEEQVDQSFTNTQKDAHSIYFFTKMGRWQYLVELFIGSILLSLTLVLAEGNGWQYFHFERFIQYFLYINWVLFCFIVLVEYFQKIFKKLYLAQSFIIGFILLQIIILLTSISLNFFNYFGQNFNLQNLSWNILTNKVGLHLSYGALLGAFCFRYIYMREQWIRQQNSELQARIHALQARIHPHFLFNSLNNVISLISIDPDKAEQMLLNLSQLFRASLKELKLVNLNDEIELCKKYLEIEQIRLGNRLNVEWKFENQQLFSEIQIPLLTLQPLLENSIFHGVEKILSRSTVGILVEVLEHQVNIVITNPFIIDKTTKRPNHGIAVQNVKQRLEAYYGRSVNFRMFAGEKIYTTVIQYRHK